MKGETVVALIHDSHYLFSTMQLCKIAKLNDSIYLGYENHFK